ncbi:hypothetical protein C8C77_1171 [Halanaerobium saccharolyticum]|uniref:Uncharacterized protein n=1 Tax=Halanaerobium saccharolyticum TaxID=43595 RepID=A0A4R7YW25_9FIRM|nr:hypothetical protein [Halanaerobium saccharolyticum]RAK07161.1 hypothetical protein C7958_1161 [Halanaerobium saccharolyticum]TDW02074.1 hypothetical protein C8C77_1171 [Halanaerobium saccharolyticum]TDX58805.1 hypothetical protein C7956_1171 [Halanaerobium saccharolyticum]
MLKYKNPAEINLIIENSLIEATNDVFKEIRYVSNNLGDSINNMVDRIGSMSEDLLEHINGFKVE